MSAGMKGEFMDKKTPWREFFKSDFLSSWDFEPGEKRNLTIKGFARKDVPIPESSRKDSKLTISFAEAGVKPMVLNATNCKTMAKLSGSKHVEDWVGSRITVYTVKTKLKGEEVDGLRIMPTSPQTEKPSLTPDSQRWNGAVEAIKSKRTTMKWVRDNWIISDAHAEQLEREAQDA